MVLILFPLCAFLQFTLIRSAAPARAKFLPALGALATFAIGYFTDNLPHFLYGGTALLGLCLGALLAAPR